MNHYVTLAIALVLGILIGRIKKTTLTREDKPYLIRITLFKCKWFTIKIHKTLMSDPANHHDHPWNYTSLILWGGYIEERIKTNSIWTKEPLGVKYSKWYGPLSLLHRNGKTPHKLIIPKGRYCISLIFISPKWRDWGFVNDAGKWVSHKDGSYDNTTFKERTKKFIRTRLTAEDINAIRDLKTSEIF